MADKIETMIEWVDCGDHADKRPATHGKDASFVRSCDVTWIDLAFALDHGMGGK
ncbi:hypothetical protein ACVMAJ_005217 [Bradyrhizobium sp. USDA 4448]